MLCYNVDNKLMRIAARILAAATIAATVTVSSSPAADTADSRDDSTGGSSTAVAAAAMAALLQRGHYMGQQLNVGAPADFECSWRNATFAYARVVQPFLSTTRQRQLHDALELAAHCGQAFVAWAAAAAPPAEDSNAAAGCPGGSNEACVELHVNTVEELHTALAQVAAATAATAAQQQHYHILLSPGKYFLDRTLVLTEEHSGTTISPARFARHGSVVISGSRQLAVAWKRLPAPSADDGGRPIFVTDVPAGLRGDALQVDGKRAILARYPNANPETDQFPHGWILNHTTSIPPTYRGPTTANLSLSLPGAYTGWGAHDPWGVNGFGGAYRLGIGGACETLTPPESYWCQPGGRVLPCPLEYAEGGKSSYFFRTPAGIRNASALLPHAPYGSLGRSRNATVHYWRPGHWWTVMFAIEKMEEGSGDIVFGRGGFQGAEGHDAVAEWFVSGLLKELDSANEYWYDSAHGKLYLMYNGSAVGDVPPSTVEMPLLTELIVLNGTQTRPVQNVTLTGLTLTGQPPTYLEPHGHPSAGEAPLN